MMKKNIAFCVVIMLMTAGAFHLFAQEVKKKKTEVVTNRARQVSDTVSHKKFLIINSFPEFYARWPVNKNDTLLKYECYGAFDSLVNADTLHNMDNVRHISLEKIYTDYTRTFIDKDGSPKPMEVSALIIRYDKIGSDKWTSTDIATDISTHLLEFKDDIVRADTQTIVNPVNGEEGVIVYKYYKVVEMGK